MKDAVSPRRMIRPAAALLAVAGLLGFILGGPAARGQDRNREDPQIRRGLAVVDSLIGTDPAAAAVRARALMAKYGEDPLFGWQIEGRLAAALLAADRPAEAVPLLENLVRRNPREPAAHRNLADALRQLGRRGRALTEYGLVVELAPEDPDARLEYGQYLLEFRNWSLAAHHLEEARHLCGGCPEADRALANLHLARGDWEDALEPLRRLEEGDGDPQVERSLLAALAHTGRDEELIGRLEDMGISDLDPEQLRLLVDAEGRLGRSGHSLAFADDDPPVPALPDDASFWGQVALNLLTTGDFAAGLRAVDRAIALDPSSITHRTNRVVLLERLGREDEARAEWAKLRELESAPDSSATNNPPPDQENPE